MTDRDRIRSWFIDLTGLGGTKATRATDYVLRRERRAHDRGYEEGFMAGFRVAQEPCPTCDAAAAFHEEIQADDGVLDLR